MELIEAPQAIHLDPNVVGNHKFGSSSATRKETRSGVAKDLRVETLDRLCMLSRDQSFSSHIHSRPMRGVRFHEGQEIVRVLLKAYLRITEGARTTARQDLLFVMTC